VKPLSLLEMWSELEATQWLHLVNTLRMSGITHSLPHTASWREEKKNAISGVTVPEALTNNQINIYYITNLALVKANKGSFTKTCDIPSVTTSYQ
jgi:hypothetical protein